MKMLSLVSNGFSIDCLLLLLQELVKRGLHPGTSSSGRYGRRRNKDIGPVQRGGIFSDSIRSLKTIVNYLRMKINSANVTNNTRNGKDLDESRPSRTLRYARGGTLCLIVLVWCIAITTGIITMILDIISDGRSSNALPKPGTTPVSTPYCTNAYLEKLTGRYIISIITV